ncbi:WecB/TagA/CpsF family glycosyltransferase [Oricola sp.]|uniref:WecB/TagA/CpsF family glycosyltransferase n=1 Tax=Oricola sp. TaxID=1979950 RepID=UPI003BA92812
MSRSDALDFVHRRIAAGTFTPVTFLNAHNANVAVEEPGFRQTLQAFTVFSDGIGVDLAARILYGRPFRANLNGTDFVPDVLRSAPRPLKIGLFGARPGVAGKAAARLRAIETRHEYQVFGHGYLGAGEVDRALDDIARWRPDILLVALGVPLQERWISEKLTADHCTMAMGIGALFDMITDTVPRAPRWMRALRCEWIYRLWREPRRLWRRYILGNPLFLVRVAVQRL